MLYTITARRVLCDDRGKLHRQPVHWATTLPHHDLLFIAHRHLREEYGVGNTGSTSSADYVANDVLEPWFSVSLPGGRMFDSLRFATRFRVRPLFVPGDRSHVRWSAPDENILDEPLEVLDVTTAWPYIWVALDSEPYPRRIRFTHVEQLCR